MGRFLNADDISVIMSSLYGLTDKNLIAYCDNNPVVRKDDGGYFWDTVFDVISLGSSIVEVCINPADPWAWVGLVGDAVDLIPFVSGVGETARLVNTGRKALDVADDIHDAEKVVDGTIDTYKNLRKVNKGNGKEVHHIIEKRFAKELKIGNTNEMLSIALDKDTHRKFTNEWRTALPYKRPHTSEEIWEVAQKIYQQYPELLEAARKTLWR